MLQECNAKFSFKWTHEQAKELQIITHTEAHTHRADTRHVLGAVLYAVCAVSILQVTGCSVGVENTQVFWTIHACRGNNRTETLI